MGEIGEIWREKREEYKERRSRREQRFRSELLPLLSRYNPEDLGDKITLTDSRGKIDVFPKADRLLLRRNNKWISRASVWIRKNLLTE